MILLNILMIFGIKIDNFDPYNVFLAIATNILQRLKTGFVNNKLIMNNFYTQYCQVLCLVLIHK